MMLWFALNVAVSLITSGMAANAECIEDDKNVSNSTRLVRNLLCNYDKNARPVKDHTKTVSVTIYLGLKYVSSNGETYLGDRITIHSWLYLLWHDEYLEWKPKEYGNIITTYLWSSKIWIPEISVHNSKYQKMSYRDQVTECDVTYDGQVICPLHASQEAVCKRYVKHWPYDWQNCTLEFKTWLYQGEHINLTDIDYADDFKTPDFKEGSQWFLKSVNVSRNNGEDQLVTNVTYPSVSYSFILTRFSAIPAAAMVAPAGVLMVLNLISITMDLQSFERIQYLMINLYCHFLYTKFGLTWDVIFNGEEVPFIVVFFRDSSIICVVIFAVTLHLKKMVDKKSMVPNWIDLIIYFSNTKTLSWIMYASKPRRESTAITGEDVSVVAAQIDLRNNEEWKHFAMFADRVLFLLIFVSYVCILISGLI